METNRTCPSYSAIGNALRLCGMVLAGCCFPVISQAQIIANPGFEGSFTGWTLSGDTRIQTSTYGVTPNSGTSDALISNDSFRTPGAVVFSTLESFLGLSAGSLSAVGNGNVLEGSAVRQQVNGIQAGQTLTFAYDFLTAEAHTTPQTANDFAFLMIRSASQTGNQSSILTLATVSSLYSGTVTTLPAGSSAAIDFGPAKASTGYQPGSFQFNAGGDYMIAFGVVDVGPNALDYSTGNSGLLVDTLNLTAVPEPQQWTLIAGLALSAAALVRRSRAFRSAVWKTGEKVQSS